MHAAHDPTTTVGKRVGQVMRGVGSGACNIVPKWLPGTFMPTPPLTADLEGSLTGLTPPGKLAGGTDNGTAAGSCGTAEKYSNPSNRQYPAAAAMGFRTACMAFNDRSL